MSLILVTRDGRELPADINDLLHIGALAQMVDVCQDEGLSRIPVLNVDSQHLTTVLEWVRGHKTDVIQYATETNGPLLLDLMNAADYLSVPDLVDELCRLLADRIRNQSPEDIASILGLQPRDPEQLQAVQIQHALAFFD
jgi:hypothetical protein